MRQHTLPPFNLLEMDSLDDLIGTAEIVKMTGMTRLYVTNTLTKRSDFPDPEVDVTQRQRKWSRRKVQAFLDQTKSKRRRSTKSRDR